MGLVQNKIDIKPKIHDILLALLTPQTMFKRDHFETFRKLKN